MKDGVFVKGRITTYMQVFATPNATLHPESVSASQFRD